MTKTQKAGLLSLFVVAATVTVLTILRLPAPLSVTDTATHSTEVRRASQVDTYAVAVNPPALRVSVMRNKKTLECLVLITHPSADVDQLQVWHAPTEYCEVGGLK